MTFNSVKAIHQQDLTKSPLKWCLPQTHFLEADLSI